MKLPFVNRMERRLINCSPNQLIPYIRSEFIVCRFGDASMAGLPVNEGPQGESDPQDIHQ